MLYSFFYDLKNLSLIVVLDPYVCKQAQKR